MLIIPLLALLLVWYALILIVAMDDDEPRITRPLPEVSSWRDRQTQPITLDPVPIWSRTTFQIAVV
jgi:hypothetical protein